MPLLIRIWDPISVAGFIPVAEYGNRQPLCPEEIRSVEDVRYILSPELAAFENTGSSTLNDDFQWRDHTDVYPVIYVGKKLWMYGSKRH